jgi:hypothetical protein
MKIKPASAKINSSLLTVLICVKMAKALSRICTAGFTDILAQERPTAIKQKYEAVSYRLKNRVSQFGLD